MAPKILRGDDFLVDFTTDATSDGLKCELSAAVGIENGIEHRQTIAEIAEESPHRITIWRPVGVDGWQLDAQEFLRRLQHLVSAFGERGEGRG